MSNANPPPAATGNSDGPGTWLVAFGIAPLVLSIAAVAFAWLLKVIGLVGLADWFLWFCAWTAILLGILWAIIALCTWLCEQAIQTFPHRNAYFVIGMTCLTAAVWGQQRSYNRMFASPPHAQTAAESSSDVAPAANAAANQRSRSQLADTQAKIAQLTERRAAIQTLLDKTSQERDALLVRLKQMGITSSADLKGNSRARQYADMLHDTVSETERLQRDIARFDHAIAQAQSLVRRLERAEALEASGLSELDEEVVALAQRTMELDDRLDGFSEPITDPVRQAAMLDQELQRQVAPSASLTAVPGDPAGQLIGRWEIVEGEQKGHVQFTPGGTVIFVWFHPGLRKDWTETGKYLISGNSLEIQASGEYGSKSVRDIEFLSGDELIINKPKGFHFNWLFGRLKRLQASDN